MLLVFLIGLLIGWLLRGQAEVSDWSGTQQVLVDQLEVLQAVQRLSLASCQTQSAMVEAVQDEMNQGTDDAGPDEDMDPSSRGAA